MPDTAPRLLALTLTAALVAAACSDDDVTTGDQPPAPPEAINATVSVEPVEANPISATVSIESNLDVGAQVTATSADHEVATPTTAATTSTHRLPLVGLREGRTYDLTVTLTTAAGAATTVTDSFTTGVIDIGLPDLEIAVDPARSAPGMTVLELNPVEAVLTGTGTPMVGVDEEGEVVWFYRSAFFTGALHRTPNGTIAAQNYPLGLVELDVTGNLLTNYFPDPGNLSEASESDGTRNIPYSADWVELNTMHHDVFPMDDGSLLFISSTVHPLTDEQRALAACPNDGLEWGAVSDVIVHMDPDGIVVRTWDLWDILSFEDAPGNFLCGRNGLGITDLKRDWTHANALVFDPDRDAVIVSVRHTDQIVALDMTEETGPQTGVRWIIGRNGTIGYAGESFHHTHGVKVMANGDLLTYDNGNFRPGTTEGGGDAPPYSRALRIAVDDGDPDPAAWSAGSVWEHRMDDPLTGNPIYSSLISDADELSNGNILVTHGAATGDFFHVHIVEVVPEGASGGEIVWELQLGTADAPYTMYRADRWESPYFGPLWES